jgi:hypothetical protein
MKKLQGLLLLLLLPFCSRAWDSCGHYTAGAVAFYYLQQHDPATLQQVVAILQQHPWYSGSQWQGRYEAASGGQQVVHLFMLASVYPDEARSYPELGGGIKGKWHYIDYPYVPAGQNVVAQQPDTPNAEQRLTELLANTAGETDKPQQAIDLCWIFHLTEDLHQPLHTVSLFDKGHPRGDRGGNDTYILFPSSTSPVKLHRYWDELVKCKGMDGAARKAQQLLAEPKYAEAKLAELKDDPAPHDWITKESYMLAIQKVYDNGTIAGTKVDPSHVAAAYALDAQQAGERRVVLSGLRLAKELEAMFR